MTLIAPPRSAPQQADNPRAIIGDNRPPIEEQGVADFNEAVDGHKALRSRIIDLLGSAERAKAEDEDDVGRCAELIRQIREVEKIVDAERTAVKAPYLNAGRKIDDAAKALVFDLGQAAARVRRMSEDFMRRREAELAAERRRLEEEQRRQREAAERAAAEELQRAEAEGRAPVPEIVEAPIAVAARPVDTVQNQIRSDFGAVASARRVKVAVITDWQKAFKAVKSVPKVQEAVQTAINALVRAGQTNIPGVEIKDDIGLSVR